MSSPVTVGVGIDPVVSLLAAAAIRAGQAVAAGYAEAARLHEEHGENAQARVAAQIAASQQGRATLEADIADAERRLTQLAGLASSLGLAKRVATGQPKAPETADQASRAAYAHGLKQFIADLQHILLT